MERILLVDDNHDLLQLFSIVLTRQGYMVATADGGDSCITQLKKDLPDLILLDIMMEPVDGWETLGRIRSDETTRHLPVIIVSGKQPTREEIRTRLAEIDGYIIKPLTMAELSSLVKNYFTGRISTDRGMQALREAGAGENLILEFRQLCKLILAGSSLTRIMPELKPDIEEITHGARRRLGEIRQEYRMVR